MVAGSVLGVAAPVFAAPTAPVNLSIVGGKYTNDTTPTFTWTPAEGATWYEFLLDDGSWQGIGNVSTYTLSTLPNGWHTFYVRSHDNANGVSVSSALTFEIDTQGPTVSAVTPTSAKVGVSTDFSITSTGEAPTMYCQFRVNGHLSEKLHIKSGGGWTLPITFTSVGSNVVQATCVDADNNSSNGPVQFVGVSKNIVVLYDTFPPATRLSKGDTMKTQCGTYAPVNDPCHAVYYYGLDGKRHAFLSEFDYKSWYDDSFANVHIISVKEMNALSEGTAVRMRPGTYLVKFADRSTVYAVKRGGVLWAIKNEAVAKAIYGSNWKAHVITISDAFKRNYTGKNIYSSADYSKSEEFYGTPTIDQNWE